MDAYLCTVVEEYSYIRNIRLHLCKDVATLSGHGVPPELVTLFCAAA